MRSLGWAFVALFMLCTAARADRSADTQCRAVALVEEHVAQWRAASQAPDAANDSGYRKLFGDLRSLGFIASGMSYDQALFGRTHYFFELDTAILRIQTTPDRSDDQHFTIEHTGFRSKVIRLARGSVTDASIEGRPIPLDVPCLPKPPEVDTLPVIDAGPGITEDPGSLLGVTEGAAAAPEPEPETAPAPEPAPAPTSPTRTGFRGRVGEVVKAVVPGT